MREHETDQGMDSERIGSPSSQWKSLEERTLGSAPKEQRFNPFSNDFLSRREFLEWSSAMVAVLGATSCTRQAPEQMIPYTKTPEGMIPGKPNFYSSAFSVSGMAAGVLVESHMGRPTKIEGNPDHPASLGASDSFQQASILSLYDPDRSQLLKGERGVGFWNEFSSQIRKIIESHREKQGEGLRILTETVISPTLGGLLQSLLAKYPKATWHQFETVNRDSEIRGLSLAIGKVASPRYDFKQAKLIVSFDSDFLGEPASMAYARGFAEARSVASSASDSKLKQEIARFFSVESSPTITGAMADHRMSAAPHEIERLALSIAHALDIPIAEGVQGLSPELQKWANWVVADAKNYRGSCLFVAGRYQSPIVHAVTAALNSRFGTLGKTVSYLEPVEVQPVVQEESFQDLVDAITEGKVRTLVILGGNPAFSALSNTGFENGLAKVPNRIHCGPYIDETAELCNWHVPESHVLEQWGDVRCVDGSVSLVQPLIDPIYGGKSHIEVVAALLGIEKSGMELVRENWKKKISGDFDAAWTKALRDGVVAGASLSTVTPSLQSSQNWRASSLPPKGKGSVSVFFRPDPTIWDGRFANNGWLQELPKPLTKLTWDNAVHLSPGLAAQLGISNRDLVEVSIGEQKVQGGAWIQPGHCADSVTLHLGYGRRKTGRIGKGTGFNANVLRRNQEPWTRTGAAVRKVGGHTELSCTQSHHDMEGRELVRHASLSEFVKNPGFAKDHHHGPKALHGVDVGTAGGENAPLAEAQYQWGMVIDLSSCTGCNACVVACQAENNVPVVGKVEVGRGREMHWLRIDRYYEGAPENPDVHFQPVACMHCETAPCEVVCPVGATVHDNEGLNNMVYNRCVGTKYCSNNCPYKVRRFNFLEYADMQTPVIKMARNPDVTVRSEGVMEKCTYCIQRINLGRQSAKVEGRRMEDGEVQTACQSACPSRAISFGSVSDPNSRVSKLKSSPLNYDLLGVLNTKPRTTYLGKVKNPATPTVSKDHGHGSHGNDKTERPS